MADIGRPEREIDVRPLHLPLPAELPAEAPSQPAPLEPFSVPDAVPA
jgi:hypothetical protein